MIKSFKNFSDKQNLNESRDEGETSYFDTSESALKNIILFDEDKIILQQLYSKEVKIPLSKSINYVELGFENYKKIIEEIRQLKDFHKEEIRKILSVADSLIMSQVILLKNEIEDKVNEK